MTDSWYMDGTKRDATSVRICDEVNAWCTSFQRTTPAQDIRWTIDEMIVDWSWELDRVLAAELADSP